MELETTAVATLVDSPRYCEGVKTNTCETTGTLAVYCCSHLGPKDR